MRHLMIPFAAAALLAAACQSTDEAPAPRQESRAEVRFAEPHVGKTSRAAVVADNGAALQQHPFAVWAYQRDDWNEGMFILPTTVSWSEKDGIWNLDSDSPFFYAPNTNYKFFAIWPSFLMTGGASEEDDFNYHYDTWESPSGTQLYAFALPMARSTTDDSGRAAVDVLIGETLDEHGNPCVVSGDTPPEDGVQFTFRHLLSRVRLAVRRTEDSEPVRIKSISLEVPFYKTATYYIDGSQGYYNLEDDLALTDIEDMVPLDILGDEIEDLSTDPDENELKAAELYLVPNNPEHHFNGSDEDKRIYYIIVIHYLLPGDNENDPRMCSIGLFDLDPGVSYDYTFEVGEKEIRFNATSQDWDTGNATSNPERDFNFE